MDSCQLGNWSQLYFFFECENSMNYKIWLSALYELSYGISPFSIPPSLEYFCCYGTIPQNCCLSAVSSSGKDWKQKRKEKNLSFTAFCVLRATCIFPFCCLLPIKFLKYIQCLLLYWNVSAQSITANTNFSLQIKVNALALLCTHSS